MDLFSTQIDVTSNLLPVDGTVNYYGRLFSTLEANHYLNYLLHNIEWKNDEAIIIGKPVSIKKGASFL